MTRESLKRRPVPHPGEFHGHPPLQGGAFTLVEVLTILAILVLLACLMLPALARTTTQTKVAQCEANLKQDVLALQQFAGDAGDLLPTISGGYWPWDFSATTEYKLEPYGMHRTQLYDPGFLNQNINQMWNLSVIYNSSGVPTSGKRVTGYAFALPGTAAVVQDDQNTSLAAQVEQIYPPRTQYSDPQLTQTIPAVNGVIKINPARRVLVTDALISNSGQTDPTQYQNYTWNLHPEDGYPNLPSWQVTPFGPWLGSGTPHLNSQLLPNGGNEGMLDGHVKWVPFSGMATHTVHGYGGDEFWWQSDPAKL